MNDIHEIISNSVFIGFIGGLSAMLSTASFIFFIIFACGGIK